MKHRILIISQYFWPENFRINDFVAEMVTRGHQVTVLTGIPNYPEGTVNPDFLREPEKFREWSGAEIINGVEAQNGSLQLAQVVKATS